MSDLSIPRRLMLAIAFAGALGTGAAGLGYVESLRTQAIVLEREEDQNGAYRLRQSLTEAESAIRVYLLFLEVDSIERFHRAVTSLESAEAVAVIRMIDNQPGATPIAPMIAAVLAGRRSVLREVANGGIEAVLARGRSGVPRRSVDDIQRAIAAFVDASRADIARQTERLRRVQQSVLLFVAGSVILSGLGLAFAWLLIRRRSGEAEAAGRSLSERSRELGALLRMNEMLQSCHTRDDIEGVVSHAALRVMPRVPGSLYVFANSRDRLDRAAAWPAGAHDNEPDHFSPSQCWALKRGRPHACGAEGLRCEDRMCGSHALCLPMAARGEVYGVLRFAEASMLGQDHEHHRRLADALSDGVSMALANLSLREKLRGEALRDSMTGLYNRRFLEEVAPAIIRQAERRGAPVCVVMLDVDHFKPVNDTHGHAVGDALLRALAATLTGALRTSDIVCRYGGEEFLLLLPDCELGAAFERMDEVRRLIQAMHQGADTALPGVTASMGVAQVPPGMTTLEATIRQADEALYLAKQSGRNRVMTAAMAERGAAPELAIAAPGRPGE